MREHGDGYYDGGWHQLYSWGNFHIVGGCYKEKITHMNKIVQIKLMVIIIMHPQVLYDIVSK